MTSYDVLLSKYAAKQLKQLEKMLQTRIKLSLHKLGENPFVRRSGCDVKELHRNREPRYHRLRVGDYRIIFTVADKKVKITEILHRKNAYEFLD